MALFNFLSQSKHMQADVDRDYYLLRRECEMMEEQIEEMASQIQALTDELALYRQSNIVPQSPMTLAPITFLNPIERFAHLDIPDNEVNE